MITFDSRVRHVPPEAYGDCFAACIRSLIEDPDFPHVLHDGADSHTQRIRTSAWLKDYGLGFVEFPIKVSTVGEALIHGAHYARFTGIHYTLSGNTVKERGHYVVCRGDKIVHNPTEGAEIVAPHETGVFWIGIIVKLL